MTKTTKPSSPLQDADMDWWVGEGDLTIGKGVTVYDNPHYIYLDDQTCDSFAVSGAINV